MIDVKGFKTAGQAASSEGDPLQLKKPEGSAVRTTSAIMLALASLGLYLRSFLPASMAEERGLDLGAEVKDESLPTLAKLRPVAGTGRDSKDGAQEPRGEAVDTTTTTDSLAKIVSESWTEGLFGKRGVLPSKLEAEGAANAHFPPFRDPTWASGGSGSVGSAPARPPIKAEGDQFVIPDLGASPNGHSLPEPPKADHDSGRDDQPRNRAPRNQGAVALGDVGSGATLAIGLAHLLGKTWDPDGDALSVRVDHVGSGHLQKTENGWTYVADPEHLGEVRIVYTVGDGEHSISQTATLNVVRNLIVGSEGPDVLTGTRGQDVIEGKGGDDRIVGLGAADHVEGGHGDDVIAGEGGNDRISGGDGNDLLDGGTGDDVLAGDAGNDRLLGGDGADELSGGDGDDELDGGSGDDKLEGGEGRDALAGGDDDDSLDGGNGDDELFGGAGKDTLGGAAGNDRLFGEEGADALNGGEGDDQLSGGLGDDALRGDAGHDVLAGEAGNDDLDGGDDDDLILGGAGKDVLAGGRGSDILLGGDGDDTLRGEEGDDLLSGGEGRDVVEGGSGNDHVIADADAASDHHDGGEGIDRLDFSASEQGVEIDLSEGTAQGISVGEDSFGSFESFVGSVADDVFQAGSGSASLTGNGGDDLYSFVAGDFVGPVPSVYSILDFGVGDVISVTGATAGWQIRKAMREVEDRIEDLFESIAETIKADEPKLRYSHDWTEDYQRTLVEVDFDHDSNTDLTVVLEGEHLLAVNHA